MNPHEHWQNAYRSRESTELSWYAAHLVDSLALIGEVSDPRTRLIDVGGGASTLVDDLLARGYMRLTVLDISSAALEVAKQRLGEDSTQVSWVVADITSERLEEGSFDLWHDRAVFHFMTSESARQAYVATLRRALALGGHAVIGTFSLEGPTKCSGLDVTRYDSKGLLAELGEGFELLQTRESTHLTPGGREQRFMTCCFRRER